MVNWEKWLYLNGEWNLDIKKGFMPMWLISEWLDYLTFDNVLAWMMNLSHYHHNHY